MSLWRRRVLRGLMMGNLQKHRNHGTSMQVTRNFLDSELAAGNNHLLRAKTSLNNFIASLEHLASPQDFPDRNHPEVLKSYLLKALKDSNANPTRTIREGIW